MLAPNLLHPAVHDWFTQNFSAPTPAQADAWPAIERGENVLIAAPTGSGKTLAAFLTAIDGLVRLGVNGDLTDATHVVYVSPLKALSNDIQKNLEFPLLGIRAALRARGLPDVDIRTWVRTGDTPQRERAQARKLAPHIVVTTPESLYILLGSESGRAMLATTRTVIVDEIHALAPNKRGSHLALSLERLAAVAGGKLQRIGLSATQKPIEDVARFLVGAGTNEDASSCTIIDSGHKRPRDLGLEVPPSPLEAVMSGEQWTQVYDRLAALVNEHRTTLIFVNTRRMVERVSRELSTRLGEDQLAAHHGSLSREQRLDAEQRLKHGKLKALIATASLELGIDIGEIDLVCQLGSPRSIASFLQRVGRSGHAVSGTPRGRLFALSRDELVECAALLASVQRGELDRLTIPNRPLDVLAQQIVAEVAAQEWNENNLYALIRGAWPYRNLRREEFTQIITMLAEGFSTRRGRRGALIHHDGVNHMLRERRGARLTAITSGGAIPDNADYRVQLEPENQFIGTVHEDFAVESLAGDVFQLGNQSYRIMRVERGTVRVEDAHGQPPTIPFWLGEAPGRSDELSRAVSRLRGDVAARMDAGATTDEIAAWFAEQPGSTEPAARDLAAYLSAGYGALGCLPTQDTLVFERFFDESGGMQLVIHSPYGSRINRAWGLSLRKRFCRKFNFELQAAATEDNIVLSLSASHSFDLAEVRHYLRAGNVREILIDTLLDAPMFATRWRWVASTALALPRFRGGRKRAPQLIRMDAEDLVAAIFPDQLACADNLVGAREIPDHPLVTQTIDDCLHEAMDIGGLEALLTRLEAGEIRVVAKDLTEPSPLAMEVLAARPYAYLDDAPLEERRTQAVQGRRWIDPETASDLGHLDADAIERVRDEIKSDPRNADELHDTMVWLGYLTVKEAAASDTWSAWLSALASDGRITEFDTGKVKLWITAERLPQFRALWPAAEMNPPITTPSFYGEQQWSSEAALVEIVRGRLEGSGPVRIESLASDLALPVTTVTSAMLTLEGEGFVMRGCFTPGTSEEEWCERRLLARIHRYTLKRLRAEIEPVAAKDFLRFLLEWQHVAADTRLQGPGTVNTLIGQLEGFEAPAYAWESEILPARLANYKGSWLDQQSQAGRITWSSLRRRGDRAVSGPIRTTPISLLTRRQAHGWTRLSPPSDIVQASGNAQAVMSYITVHGASFFDEIVDGLNLLRIQVEQALGELVGLGLVTSDSFGGLRTLIEPSEGRILNHRGHASPMEQAGRWSAITRVQTQPDDKQARTDAVVYAAHTLLRRYGVVFWRLLDREPSWLPSWRELLAVYRRLEARGEIRGGRFVAGFAGEQFALPEAIGLLREIRRKDGDGAFVSVSGADPLNLAGILTPGAKLPALSGNRVLYRDGVPIAFLIGGEVRSLEGEDNLPWEARKALLRSPTLTSSRGEDAAIDEVMLSGS